MTYETFKIFVCRRIRELLPENASIQLQEIQKNNGLRLDGLTITTKGCNISPTIFLNFYYEKRTYFPDMETLCQDIVNTYEHHRPKENIDIQFFLDYEQVKEHLAYRIVNYEKNKELLQTVPHIRYLDLAVVFYCLLTVTDANHATILVNEHHLSMWNVSAQELYEQTAENTPGLLPYAFHNLSSLISEMIPQKQKTTPPNSFCEMYVLTNSSKLYGASCILYPHLLEEISEKLDSDLILLPCSIHECILLAAKECYSIKNLKTMVMSINQTELSKDEILSSNIYCFSRKNQTLSVCS